MGTFAKIKALQVNKQKTFRILLLVEVLLLVLGIVGLFGKNNEYQYYPDETGVNFEGIALDRGTYRVQMYYTTDTNMKNTIEVTSSDIGKESVRINVMHLFQGWDHTDEEMWLLRDTKQLAVRVNYGGEGSLQVQGLLIKQTNAMNRIYLFCLFVLFTVVNVTFVYREYDRAYQISQENKTVTFLLGLIVLIASMPLMLDYMWSAGDLGYHLMRVEGIKDGILNGQFPIRISPDWQQGYGYASPIFYGETVLYVAALFRLIGFSVTTSYRIFMFIVTVATVLIAYYCFKKMFRNAYIGVFCSGLYTLSIYRIYKTYACGSWGECFGIMFLPLLAYGFYRVFTQDIREESYKRSWVPLTIGFSMLIQSHLLSGELAGFFTILLCVILWKKVFRLQTFVVLAKTVIYSILLSAWFLVPFLDYMLTGDFVIQHVSARTIQERGLYPAHLFTSFFGNGGMVFFEESGMYHTDAMGVGIVLVIALLLFGYLLLVGKLDKLGVAEKSLGKITALFAVVSMVMSLSLFPWDRIQFINQITQTLVSSIQFPNRLLTIANVCLTVVAGVVASFVLQSGKRAQNACFFGGMVACLLVGSLYLTEDMMDQRRAVKIYNEQGMGTGYISGAEYLPYGANASLFMPHNPVGSDEVIVKGSERKALGAEAYVVNNKDVDGEISFDLLYYKGYRAYRADTGEVLPCYAGENFEVTVEIPEDFDGMVNVQFKSPWYWRVGEIVTLCTLLVMVVFGCRKRYEVKRVSEVQK